MRERSKVIKGRARCALHGKYSVPMLALLIELIVYLMISAPFSQSILVSSKVSSRVVYVIANILLFMVLFEVGVGISYIHLKIARNERAFLRDMLFAFQNRPDRFIVVFLARDGIFFICLLPTYIMSFTEVTESNYVSFTLLMSLVTLVGCIIAVIITIRFVLAEYLMLDNVEMSGVEALKESMRLMKGNNKNMLYIYASFIGYSMLGLLSFNVGFLWLVPYMTQTVTCFYLDTIGETFYRDVVKDPVIDVTV